MHSLSFFGLKLTISNSNWMQMMALEKQYHEEVKMELQGVPYSSSVTTQTSVQDMEVGEESLPDLQQVAEDTTNMSKVMMSRKKRGLLEAIEVKLQLFLKCFLFFLKIFHGRSTFYCFSSIHDSSHTKLAQIFV